MYSAGVAALSANNYKALASILTTPVYVPSHNSSKLQPLTVAVIEQLREIADAFKRLPDHDRDYAPRSEYLYTRQQPLLEDLLFLGRTYDRHFDRFEIFLALTYADAIEHNWGPPGRFVWKHGRTRTGPYVELMKEAKRMGDNWPAVRTGLFNGSTKRFLEVAEGYKEWFTGLHWR